ncbi:unnamed protein product [Caenorhabditis bovis]|uniref:Uncharacterized protein n=1 Tax=Caenorhabditis bovis TaxID=2654633 RepID=A0A8S1ESI9_9PELO|nr:unnamed protein product [Caenorhabditis bovis]
MAPRSVLVTGANRGIGLGIVKQLISHKDIEIIIATCRDFEKAQELKSINDHRLHVLQLDVDSDEFDWISFFWVDEIVGEKGLTVLLNNAGILLPYNVEEPIDRRTIIRQLETNSVSVAIITQKFLPLLKKAAAQRNDESVSINRAAIINISSTAASVEKIDGTFNGPLVAYRMSKSALNSFAKSCSIDLAKYHILVTSFCPGWVQTDMGGANALLTVADATKTLVDNILLLNGDHHGKFLQSDLQIIPN